MERQLVEQAIIIALLYLQQKVSQLNKQKSEFVFNEICYLQLLSQYPYQVLKSINEAQNLALRLHWVYMRNIKKKKGKKKRYNSYRPLLTSYMDSGELDSIELRVEFETGPGN